MLPTLLLALGAGLQAPAPAPIPEALQGQELTALVQTSASHFCAENASLNPVVVVIGLDGHGPVGTLALAPGARVVHPLPRGAAQEHWFRVVSRGPHTSPASARVSLPEVASGTSASMFVVPAADGRLAVWRGASQPRRVAAALHVPGAPPADAPVDLPPVLGDKTLPPA
ncbi:MAG: hypothetical protein ISQ08_07095 [Planctomycetes bacterium]|nr:hypothetical protein [Planctomycetota bacterium]